MFRRIRTHGEYCGIRRLKLLELGVARRELLHAVYAPVGEIENKQDVKNLPAWPLRTATSEDQGLVKDAHRQGRAQVKWPNLEALRSWAKQQRWPTPLFDFEKAFIAKVLETKEGFALAVENSGIEIKIPKQDYTISSEFVRELDALYNERSSSGRPSSWGLLVEELRGIRRAAEAGVIVSIEGGPQIQNWQDFYSWAHERYHMLEEGQDKWIGDDS